jgi:hypothetical protein
MTDRDALIEAVARAIFNSIFEDDAGDFDRAETDWQEQARREANAALSALAAHGPTEAMVEEMYDNLPFGNAGRREIREGLAIALSTLAQPGGSDDK